MTHSVLHFHQIPTTLTHTRSHFYKTILFFKHLPPLAVYCRLPLFLKGDVGLPEGSLEDILAGDSPETDKTLVG